MNTSTNRDFAWSDDLVKEFHEWIPKQPKSFVIDYSGLIDTFKSSRLSNGVEKESKYVAEAIGKDRMDIHKSPNAEWPEVLSLMIEDLSKQKNVGVDWEIESIIIEFDKRDEPMITKDRLVIYNFLKGDERYSSYKIHSVLRKSDSTTWTVGDDTNFGKIHGFKIVDDRMRVLYYHIGDWQWLSSIRKPDKQVPPKVYYEIDTSTWDIIKTEFLHFPHYFDSEEKANDYVLLNRPLEGKQL